MTQKLYCGIGPRLTPVPVLGMMTEIASQLASTQWKLRSGNGRGADQAFGAGVQDSSLKEIFLPWYGYNAHGPYPHYKVPDFTHPRAKLIEAIARKHHTSYDRMKVTYQRLMDRNVNIILGEYADSPVDMVIYWQSEEGAADYFGGTNHSIRIAKSHNIPTFNIRLDDELAALVEFVNQKEAV